MKKFVQKLNWEVWTGTIILFVIVGGAGFAEMFIPGNKPVRSDSFCRPGLFSASVKEGDAGEKSSEPVQSAGGIGDDLQMTSDAAAPKQELCTRSYLFGTDLSGNDVFLQTIERALRYVGPGLLVGLVAILIGSFFGVVEGYYGESKASKLSSILSSSISAYPPLVALILVSTLSGGKSLIILGSVFGLTEATRLSNSIVNKIHLLKNEEFIASAKEMGLSDWRIISRHILWYNCRELLLIHTIFAISSFILMEIYLGYLNLGNFAAWGNLVGPAARDFYLHPWLLLYPISIVMSAIIGFYFIGDGLMKFIDGKWDMSR